ncbi:hypothetical protein GQ55_3G386400 [Panicum hallii var. hallii]|uniref:RIN4 pathogenic type III effector avirulence factor Avr cleavage site domain-containing protein n=1 Tax=Panicum hallii var. hallii TaxID=1504633 RepID=A0A2T7EGG3_9POAL|nr:hypothetical protein GQ55_3G386400 [Panicum hallii var. hallii]
MLPLLFFLRCSFHLPCMRCSSLRRCFDSCYKYARLDTGRPPLPTTATTTTTSHPAQRQASKVMERRARRRHVPAFGEWNYHCSPSSPDDAPPEPARAAEWWCSPEPAEARSDAWFRYSPPPPRRPAPRKARRTQEKRPQYCSGKGGGVAVAARVREEPAGADVVVVARPAARASRRVVRPVDEDLYQVTSPEFVVSTRRPRQKRAARSLWMGCLGGLGCIA